MLKSAAISDCYNTGTVTLPTNNDVTVILTATITKNGVSDTKEFTLTVRTAASVDKAALEAIAQGVQAVQIILSFGQKSSALRVPMQFCYMSIPVGMILMSIRLIEKTIRELLHKDNSTSQEGGVAE